jgi:hypothetical protein
MGKIYQLKNISSKLLNGLQLRLVFAVYGQSCRDWKFIYCVRLRVSQTVERDLHVILIKTAHNVQVVSTPLSI